MRIYNSCVTPATTGYSTHRNSNWHAKKTSNMPREPSVLLSECSSPTVSCDQLSPCVARNPRQTNSASRASSPRSTVLSTICKRLNLRQRVIATANVFFRRFFSKNSYSALDPFLVCATCVYVAAKVEESPIHIKSAVAEATRTFQDAGFREMPTDHSSLAEMEFYLVEEMEFDMIVYHAYRSLWGLWEAYGCSMKDGGGGGGMAVGLGLAKEVEALGVIKGLNSVEEKQAWSGLLDGQGASKPKMVEFDEAVLQLSWFVINDTYKTDLPLMYPPYMIALAAIWIGLSLHAPSLEKVTKSMHTMQQKRSHHRQQLEQLLDDPLAKPAEFSRLSKSVEQEAAMPPSQEALTFFASLNVSLPLLCEIVQQMISNITLQHEVSAMVNDGPLMVKLLERMRESRRLDLVAKTRDRNAGLEVDKRRPHR